MLMLMLLVATAMLMLTFTLHITSPIRVPVPKVSTAMVTFPPQHVESTHIQPDKMIWRQVPL